VVQTAQNRPRCNRTACEGWMGTGLVRPRLRWGRSFVVVVVALPQDGYQVALVDHDQVVLTGGKARASDSPLRFPSPVQPPANAVPTKHGSGRTMKRCRHEAGQRRSIQTHRMRSRRPSRGVGLVRRAQPALVTPDEVFQNEIASRSKAN
jgi:hypothetical protein